MDERIIAYTLAIVLVTGFLGYLVYVIFSLVADEVRNTRDRIILAFSGTFDSSLKSNYEKYFLGRFTYYDKLPDQLRTKFLLRVRKFIRYKSFEGRNDLAVTEEMKMMLAASAVQLTFGLDNFILDYFTTIIIYPESYYSTITGLYHMGEANPKGIIVISWADFKKGYSIPDDTYNVGLHEMSHALELEQRLGGDYDFYFTTYYEKWKRIAEEEYQQVHEDSSSFLRKYAGTDRHEFFAVCIEHFFEASEEFKEKLPQLYYHLCILLNQDPMNNETHVQNVKHKSSEEMQTEAIASSELFVTRYSYGELFFLAVIIIITPVFIFLRVHILTPALISSRLIALIFVIPFALIRKKIVLYENYLGVKNGSGKLISIYALEEIVSVSFISDRHTSSIQILIVKDEKIHKDRYSYLAKAEDIETLTRLLAEKNVIVK